MRFDPARGVAIAAIAFFLSTGISAVLLAIAGASSDSEGAGFAFMGVILLVGLSVFIGGPLLAWGLLFLMTDRRRRSEYGSIVAVGLAGVVVLLLAGLIFGRWLAIAICALLIAVAGSIRRGASASASGGRP